MILMAVVSMGLMFGMPKLMENSTLSAPPTRMIADLCIVDPEMKEEFEQMQKNGVLGSGNTDTASQIQNFDLASWMAGKTDTKKSPEPAGPAKLR